MLGGDYNQLKVDELSQNTGLIPLVYVSTRGANILDMLMVSEPGSYLVKVVASPIRSDHRAIVATTKGGIRDLSKCSTRRELRRKTPNQHAQLLAKLNGLATDHLCDETDPQAAWDRIYADMQYWLNEYYPIRSVTITNREPEFVTPGIKYLLRRKNKLMRKNKIEEAGAVAEQIGKAITRANKADLRKVSHSGNIKALWDKIKEYSKGNSTMEQHNTITAEELNAHYATISSEYKEPPLRETVERPHQLVNEQVIFHDIK